MKVQVIQQKIFEIRKHKVMLDFHLAELFEVPTKSLNLAVKRNLDSFPTGFMFQLSKKEWENLRFQFETSSYGGRRYLPYAFTEHGVTMLASILKSPKARKMNITIVRAFITLKKFVNKNAEVLKLVKELKERIDEHDIQLNSIYTALENLLDEKVEEKVKQKNWEERERIGFKKVI
jgi:phage regulator Rha-like protein